MRKRRLCQCKQDRLIEHFFAGTTARTTSSLCGAHRNILAFYFLRLRAIIAFALEVGNEAMFGGEIEVGVYQNSLSLKSYPHQASNAASSPGGVMHGLRKRSVNVSKKVNSRQN